MRRLALLSVLAASLVAADVSIAQTRPDPRTAVEPVYDMVWEHGRSHINGVVAKPDLGLV